MRFGNITYNIRKRPLKTSRVKFPNHCFLCHYGKLSSLISTSTSINYMPSKVVKLRMRKPSTSQGNSSSSSTRSSPRSPSMTKGLGEGPLTSMQMHSPSLIHTKKGSCRHTADISRSSLSKLDPINTAMSSNLTRSSGRNLQQIPVSPMMMPKYPRLFSMAHLMPTMVQEGTLAGGELVVALKSVNDSTLDFLTQTAS